MDDDPHAEKGGDGPDGGVEGVIWEHIDKADGQKGGVGGDSAGDHGFEVLRDIGCGVRVFGKEIAEIGEAGADAKQGHHDH